MIGEEFLEDAHDCVNCGTTMCDCTADVEEDCMHCEMCQYDLADDEEDYG
jgi:hypothetical protein